MFANIICGDTRVKTNIGNFNVLPEEIEFNTRSGLKVVAYKKNFNPTVFDRLSNTLKGLSVSMESVVVNIDVITGNISMDSTESTIKEFTKVESFSGGTTLADPKDNQIFTQEPQGATHIKPNEDVLERYKSARMGKPSVPATEQKTSV